ncbi:MAG TPA: hypothetical protein VHP83_16330 [Aggregatilineaceae bacterium]|nr:hypothetical protein [Aggregatilineaceae bacterium]
MNGVTTIVRAPRDEEHPHYKGTRESAQNESLSWEARGVLAYLLSKPDDWEIVPRNLQQGCGRDKVYAILKELKDAGYLRREYVRSDEGKFGGVVYRLYEDNVAPSIAPLPENPDTAKPEVEPQPENKEAATSEEQDTPSDQPFTALPDTAQPFTANPTHTYKRDSTDLRESTDKSICDTPDGGHKPDENEPIGASKPTSKKQAPPRKPKPDTIPAALMNPMKDKIAELFRWSWDSMTKDEKGLILKAARQLCEAKVTPGEVPHIYAYCKAKFTYFKPPALSANLSDSRKWDGRSGVNGNDKSS